MAFHEIQFPTDISYGSSGGPEFSTEVVELGSGYEQRNINWAYARARYNVAYGVKTAAQMTALIAFFNARKGRAHGFRFKDWTDYTATAQDIGTGDGTEDDFQLYKHYTDAQGTYARKITKPVAGSVHIYFDSVEQTEGWDIDTATGIVTFTAPPAEGVAITATFEFDVPVRFESDHLPASIDAHNIRSADIMLIEVKT